MAKTWLHRYTQTLRDREVVRDLEVLRRGLPAAETRDHADQGAGAVARPGPGPAHRRARAARARVDRRRAGLQPGRHRHRRPPGPDPARFPGHRDHRADHDGLAGHLPDHRNDVGGGGAGGRAGRLPRSAGRSRTWPAGSSWTSSCPAPGEGRRTMRPAGERSIIGWGGVGGL